jgi:hypothetical protein
MERECRDPERPSPDEAVRSFFDDTDPWIRRLALRTLGERPVRAAVDRRPGSAGPPPGRGSHDGNIHAPGGDAMADTEAAMAMLATLADRISAQ